VWFGLSFDLAPGWHIYWRNPGDAGIPPEIIWSEDTKAQDLQISPFEWPVPERLEVVPDQIMDYGYSDQVVLPFQITLPETSGSALLLEGVADYLICKNICIPEQADLRFLQSMGQARLSEPSAQEKIQQALSDRPVPFSGEAALSLHNEAWILSMAGPQLEGARGQVWFFPYHNEIRHSASQKVRFGPAGLQIDLQAEADPLDLPARLRGVVRTEQGSFELDAIRGGLLDATGAPGHPVADRTNQTVALPMLIILALIGGLILNLMPCVLPVLSIKVLSIVSALSEGEEGPVRRHALWYTAGVLTSFAVLAVSVIAIRASTGLAIWGFWLQSPLIVILLILLLYLIGLWLLGVFEIGASVQSMGSGLAGRQGSPGAFFTGLLVAIVGAPCTGPFLGAALGAVMLQPDLQVLLVLLSLGLGLALPVLVISYWPGLHRLMPKPGEWMETLKQVFAFPMFLTAAWLISVLGALSDNRLVAVTVAGAAMIGFSIWALNSAEKGGRAILLAGFGLWLIIPVFAVMSALSASPAGLIAFSKAAGLLVISLAGLWGLAKAGEDLIRPLTRLAAGLVGLAGLLLPVSLALQMADTQKAVGPQDQMPAYETGIWSPEKVDLLLAEGRAIFVDFTAEWCVTCQANKVQTLQSAAVKSAFSQADVAFLVADFTSFDPQIAEALSQYGRAGVPLYLWYESGARTPRILPELLSIDLITGLVDADQTQP